MNKIDKRRLLKMYERVNSIAQQGKIGWEEYKEYLDEIVNDGQFWILQNMLSRKYGMIESGSYTLLDIKSERIYNLIRMQTTSVFQDSLKQIYDDNSCYQIGKKVYSATHSFLGELYQISKFGTNQNILIDTLVAVKGNEVINYDDTTMPLLTKYRNAIEYLVV